MKITKYIELAEIYNGMVALIEEVEERKGKLNEQYYINRLKFLREFKDRIEKEMNK